MVLGGPLCFPLFLLLFCRFVLCWRCPFGVRGVRSGGLRVLVGLFLMSLPSAASPLSSPPVPRRPLCRLCVRPAPGSLRGRPTAPVCPSALPRGPSRVSWLWFALPRLLLTPSPGLGAVGSKSARALASALFAAGAVRGAYRCRCRLRRPRRVAAFRPACRARRVAAPRPVGLSRWRLSPSLVAGACRSPFGPWCRGWRRLSPPPVAGCCGLRRWCGFVRKGRRARRPGVPGFAAACARCLRCAVGRPGACRRRRWPRFRAGGVPICGMSRRACARSRARCLLLWAWFGVVGFRGFATGLGLPLVVFP